MSEWKEYKLGELTELVTKGTTPTTIGERFIDHGVNFIKSEAVSYDGRIDRTTFVFITEEAHQKLKRSQLKADDILFSMAGVFLGKSALVTEDMLPANTNQALAIIRLNKEIALPKFIHFYLRQQGVIEFINNISGQSAQPNINFEEIKSIGISLPVLEEQTAIASVLSSLDDKIDLLHRQNKTLEQMAETLFRKWFVHRPELVEWEDADEGWEEKSLDEIAIFLNGLACQKYPPKENEVGLPVIKIKEMRTGITESSDKAAESVPQQYLVNNGDMLFSWSGSLDVILWFGGKGVLNQHLFKVTSDIYPQWFYYFWTTHHLMEFKGIAEDKATTMGHIQRKHLTNAKVIVPDGKSLIEMDNTVRPIFEKIKLNSKQIQSLTKLRDTLLPKLMSGEVRVKMSILNHKL
ncbi:MAG: hypothetical protein BGN92_09365 [Sphingobacteriales bacterium 41-5]|nr:MAG: hypothetical protein BGN92_09365 [Sphingobacteriales bacterium 41-5]